MSHGDRIAWFLVGVLAVCSVGANGCGPTKPEPVGPSALGGAPSFGGATGTAGAVPVTKCELACANLEVLGCPEDQKTCVASCELHSRDNRFTQNIDCRINARTKTEAQACGPASCRE